MEIGILGPLEVCADGDRVDLGTPKARSVLAALVLRHDEVVSTDQLIEASWPVDLPANPKAALQTNVARVRRVLTVADAGERVETSPYGYRLRLDPGELDADRFATMAARARQHLAAGDAGGAAAQLRAALRLWRGPVLGDLGDLPFAAAERARLDDLRLDATEDRIDADLLIGRHRELVPELETLAAAHPLREGLWARLAVALYRAGRPTDALDRIRQVETHLGEELGLRPSSSVQSLEHQLLVHAAELDSGPWDRDGDHRRSPRGSEIDAPSSMVVVGQPPLPRVVTQLRGTAMVGRIDELDRLFRLVGADGSGSHVPTRIAMVTGEPGIGKTRVVAEAAAAAHRSGAVVLFGRCDPDPLLPALPVAEVLDQALDAVELGLVPDIGTRAGELGRLLPDIGSRLPEVGPPTESPGDAASYLLARAVEDAVTRVASGRPLVLVVDDFHWADQLTVDLIRHLAASAELSPATTLLLTRRPGRSDRLDGLLAALSRATRVTEIVLAGLAEEETSALVSSELPRRSPSGTERPWLGRSIHEHTGGNPYFALELSRHLAGRDLAEVPVADLPLGLVAVIEQRIAELGAGATDALQVASLVGSRFDVDIVLGAATHPDASAGLRAAAAALLIRPTPARPGQYSFAHAIVRSVLTRSLGAGDREALHARVATSIATLHPGPSPHAALAHHWARAGLAHLDAAVDHSLLAAESSLARRAYEDAADRCDVGLAALEAAEVRDHRRLQLLLTAATAHDAGAEHHRAADRAEEAFELARELGDVEALARAATIALPVIPDPVAAARLEEALTLIPPEHQRRPLLLASLAAMLPPADLDRADDLIAGARRLGTAAQDIEVLHRVLSYDTLTGHDVAPEARIRSADELLDLLPADRSSLTLDVHTFRGTAHLELGDLASAERDFAAHARLAAELRTPGALAVDDQRRAMRALLAGRFDEAEGHVHHAMLHVGDDPAWVGVYGAQLVAIRIERGHLRDALAFVEGVGPPDADRPVARATRPLLLAGLDRRGEAAPLVSDLAVEHPSWRRDLFWPVATAMLADAAVAIGDTDAASVAHDAFVRIADRLVVFTLGALCWGSIRRFLGPLALLLGDVDAAVDHYERSVATHQRLGASTFLVRDRLGLAAALRQRGRAGDAARARDLVGEATGSARSLGVTHLLEVPHGRPAAG